jgi:predicted enzyme related to lactoylglutathione lyase
MGEADAKGIGLMPWADLTVPDAVAVKEFYRRVVGWTVGEVDMGGYSDYCMNEPGAGQAVAGICHARGVNASLPPVWLVYITVADVEKATATALELGGTILHGPTPMGPQGRYCVVRDPAGAVAALYEQRA